MKHTRIFTTTLTCLALVASGVSLNAQVGTVLKAAGKAAVGNGAKAVVTQQQKTQEIIRQIQRENLSGFQVLPPTPNPSIKQLGLSDKKTLQPLRPINPKSIHKSIEKILEDSRREDVKKARKEYNLYYQGMLHYPLDGYEFYPGLLKDTLGIRVYHFSIGKESPLCACQRRTGVVKSITTDEEFKIAEILVKGDGVSFSYRGHISPGVKEGEIVQPGQQIGTAQAGRMLLCIYRAPASPFDPEDGFIMPGAPFNSIALGDIPIDIIKPGETSKVDPPLYNAHLDCMAIADDATWNKKADALSKRLAKMDPSKTKREWREYLQRGREKKKRYYLLLKRVPLQDVFTLAGSGSTAIRKADGLLCIKADPLRMNI